MMESERIARLKRMDKRYAQYTQVESNETKAPQVSFGTLAKTYTTRIPIKNHNV